LRSPVARVGSIDAKSESTCRKKKVIPDLLFTLNTDLSAKNQTLSVPQRQPQKREDYAIVTLGQRKRKGKKSKKVNTTA